MRIKEVDYLFRKIKYKTGWEFTYQERKEPIQSLRYLIEECGDWEREIILIDDKELMDCYASVKVKREGDRLKYFIKSQEEPDSDGNWAFLFGRVYSN